MVCYCRGQCMIIVRHAVKNNIPTRVINKTPTNTTGQVFAFHSFVSEHLMLNATEELINGDIANSRHGLTRAVRPPTLRDH